MSKAMQSTHCGTIWTVRGRPAVTFPVKSRYKIHFAATSCVTLGPPRDHFVMFFEPPGAKNTSQKKPAVTMRPTVTMRHSLG